MPIEHMADEYGRDARNRLADAADPSPDGAGAALESFYYALNNRDADALAQVWSNHPLAQLNNPVGGILRGGDAVTGLYRKIFTGPVRLWVRFADIVAYTGGEHAVFAGRETGEYTDPAGVAAPVAIRTSRYFRYEDGRWRQYHHHGSIDDPQMLAAYQLAISPP
ncbi:YybH family protein [Pseudonocardia acaciae]|uniref:YybH family protein n=1 Tax=Pseudonocardia acaciae TaxID=551276 RepID=UPI00048D2484|nr:nuclear transport factor 2 family protein [Pseudonocardia acaciae]